MPSKTNTETRQSTDELIIGAIASGAASTRAELSSLLNLAPSTVSVRVQALLEDDTIQEVGTAKSKGGRRPQVLRLPQSSDAFAVIDIGGSHIRYGVFSVSGSLLRAWEQPVNLRENPELVLTRILDTVRKIRDPYDLSVHLKGLAVGLPAPINRQHHWIDYGSRMSGWARFPVQEWLEEKAKVPVVIENDANLMALGEAGQHPEIKRSITVKAGTAIGTGIVVNGQLYCGATGMEGDITHVRSHRAEGRPCACGNTGCLETVASGAALVERANHEDESITSVVQLIEKAQIGDSFATNLIRDAGRALGEVLCGVVGFANPDALFIGGRLSTLELFIASIRSELYGGCHPFVTQNLLISRSSLGADAGLYGGFELIRHRVFPSFSRLKPVLHEE